MSLRYLSFWLSVASATNLYVTQYSTSSVYTLSLDQSADGKYSLTEVSSIESCGEYPSWLTFDSATRTLYCSDEYGWAGPPPQNGSLTALHADEDGTLTELAKTGTSLGSAVHNVIYEGDDGAQYLAIAHYSGSALSTYSLPLEADAQPLQVFTFSLTEPGADPDRQEAPHPHQALLDPTGNFILVPDLGADLVRVFAIDQTSGYLKSCPNLSYTRGGGPRHGVFSTASDANLPRIRGRAPRPETILYVVGELSGLLEAYSVTYTPDGCLGFSKFQSMVPYPSSLPAGASLAEIRLVDDDVYVSVRIDGAFDGDDSIASLSQARNGTVAFEEITTSNGVLPRTFVVNKAGNLVAIGNQLSANVAIVARDPVTGQLGDVVANLQVGPKGEPNTLEGLSSVVWDE